MELVVSQPSKETCNSGNHILPFACLPHLVPLCALVTHAPLGLLKEGDIVLCQEEESAYLMSPPLVKEEELTFQAVLTCSTISFLLMVQPVDKLSSCNVTKNSSRNFFQIPLPAAAFSACPPGALCTIFLVFAQSLRPTETIGSVSHITRA